MLKTELPRWKTVKNTVQSLRTPSAQIFSSGSTSRPVGNGWAKHRSCLSACMVPWPACRTQGPRTAFILRKQVWLKICPLDSASLKLETTGPLPLVFHFLNGQREGTNSQPSCPKGGRDKKSLLGTLILSSVQSQGLCIRRIPAWPQS